MENELWLQKGKKLQRSGPDGLEAWGVATAAFFINFIMAGINRASGILYVEFIDAFQVDRMQASLPFTIRSVARNLLGPVVGIFGQKYGVRPVILVGGVLGTLSTIACFFATDIFWTCVFWGCFSGLGAAMIMTLTQAAIGEHFVKHISTASGIGFSGGCFGSFVFPAMFESLIEEYSIQGTFLFIAGMIMHVIPAAIILKKPTWLKIRPKKAKGNGILITGSINSLVTAAATKSTMVNRSDSEDKTELLQRSSIISVEKCCLNENKWFSENDLAINLSQNIDINLLWTKRDVVIRLLTNDGKLKFPSPEIWQSGNSHDESMLKDIIDLFLKISKDVHSHSFEDGNSVDSSEPNVDIDNGKSNSDEIIVQYSNGYPNLHSTQIAEFNLKPIDVLRNLLEKLFERDKKDVFQLFQQDTPEDLHKIVEELKHVYIVLESYKCNIDKCNNFDNTQLISHNLLSQRNSIQPSNTFWSHIKTAVWLHVKPLFLLTCLCRCAHFITLQPILTTVVDFSRDKGLPEGYGKYAIGTLALGDLFGRLFLGWLTDKKYLTLPRYMFIFMLLQGISVAALALTNSAESLLPVLTMYGLLQGCTFIQHPVLISHYMGKDEQSIALGCLNFFPGIIGFAMPFYIGYFRDTVGSYDGMFYINGSIGAFIGLLWLAEPYLVKFSLQLPQQSREIQV